MNICMQKSIYYKGYMIDKRNGYVIRNDKGEVVCSQQSLEFAKKWIDKVNKEYE